MLQVQPPGLLISGFVTHTIIALVLLLPQKKIGYSRGKL